MNGISFSLEIHARLGYNLQKFMRCHLKLLRVQDKKDLAGGDTGVIPSG